MTNTKSAAVLSPTQGKLLGHAKALAGNQGILVSGHGYRTAIALERKGLGTVRYQGPSMGWFVATE